MRFPASAGFRWEQRLNALRAETDKRQPVLSLDEQQAWGSCSATWVGRELQSGVRSQALPLVELRDLNVVM